MPRSVDEIVELFDLKELTRDRFQGRAPRSTELEKLYGGHVVAQSLIAAGRTVPDDRGPHSLHGQFLRGGDTCAPVEYRAERLRDGKSFSSRRVVAVQHGHTIFQLTASFHVRETGFEHRPPAPQVPSFEDAPALADVMERTVAAETADFWRREWEALDIRFVGDDRPADARSNPPGVQRVWIRPHGRLPDDPLLHAGLLAYVSDLGLLSASLAPHGFVVWAPGVPRASLDHSIWFHDCASTDGWLLFDQESPWAGGARGLSHAKVFDTGGSLVASLAQEGLIRPQEGPCRSLGITPDANAVGKLLRTVAG